MNRPRIPVIFALGVGILVAGAGTLMHRDLPTRTSFTRPVDDPRDAVAKSEARDAEQEGEQEDEDGPQAHPTLGDRLSSGIGERRSVFRSPASTVDAGPSRGRACLIRGPPRHG